MTIILIITIFLIAAYIFAAVTFYFGFKNWHPLCGSKATTTSLQGARLDFSRN